jgi:hypothetical protein
MVMQDISDVRPTYVLSRGIYTEPRGEVRAEVPASLPRLPSTAPRNRLGLAQWLVADENPLTARVTVNRFWQQVFGVGLVKTANDFGVQGEVPEYVELLDWLAADFRAHGWDVKRLMKTIVTSHTYRQSSRGSAELFELDPENRWLARGPRFRMPSWMLRDQALAASGLMSNAIGGPSVNVYQPVGVWQEATFGNKTHAPDVGEPLYRRSLYVFWRRIIAPTVFFDNASRQTCSVEAYRTNTPLHALRTLNDTTYVEAARVLAEQILQVADQSDRQRLDDVMLRLLARPSSDNEARILLQGLMRSRSEFAADSGEARRLVAIGHAPRDSSIDPAEHAAWTALCLAVMNLDEALTKE